MAKKVSRRAVAMYIADQMVYGTSVKSLAKQLAAYLIDTRRTKEVELIVRDIEYYLAEKGHVSGTVTSAYALSAEMKASLESFVKKQTSAKAVSLETTVDESVLGGVKIALPGKEFDATIARALTTLKTRYKKA